MIPVLKHPVTSKHLSKRFSVIAIVLYAMMSSAQNRQLYFVENQSSSSATAVRCGKVRVERNGAITQCILPLAIPGATVDYPDDNGLLAGRYAALSVSSDDVKISVLNYNGSIQPEKLGLPDLPLVRLQVRIPLNARGVNVTAVNTDFRPLEGEYSVAPVQERLYECFVYGVDVDKRTFEMDAAVYGTNASFTHPLTFESMICHDIRFIEITYCPLHYNPVTKKLFATNKAEIVITHAPVESAEDNAPNLFRGAINSVTFNGTGRPDRAEASPRGGKFIVVSKSAFFNTPTYQEYIAYRKEKGFTLVDSIVVDNISASDITSKIKSLYSSLKMDYVIVLGDETIVPIPTDGGNYHYKNWSRLQGTDNIEDVGLGIFLCDTEEKLKNIIQHQKWHEAGGDWSRTHLSAAGSEIKSGKWDRFSSGHAGTVHLDNPNGGLGYTVRRVYQVSSTPTKYGGSYIGLPTVEFEPWTLTPSPFYTSGTKATDSIVKYWNAGVVHISHRDHGFNDGPSSPPMKYGLFSTGKITHTCSPFFSSLNCLSGNFKGKHGNNFAYQSQVCRYGTCATIAAPVETFSGDNDKVHMAMHTSTMYPKSPGAIPITNIGQIWLVSHLKGESHSRTYFHIFGDPMTNLALGQGGKPFISLVSPNGGELIEQGGAYTIAWGDNIDGTIRIELFKSGSVVKTLVSSMSSNGFYEWSIGKDIVPGADYKIKVTSLDSAGLFDQSDYTFSIVEECIISKFPYIENFDTLDSGSITLPFGWHQSDTDDIDWIVWLGPTPTKVSVNPSSGPNGDHTSGSGNYIYVEATDNNPEKKADHSTPKFNFKSAIGPRLTFWCHMFSNYQGKDQMGHLYIDVCVDGTWKSEVFQVTKNQGDEWKQHSIDLTPYKGDRTVFRFRAVTGSGFASDFCIDDLEITSLGTQAQGAGQMAAPANFDLLAAGSGITYHVPSTGGSAARIAIVLYDLRGKRVKTLCSGLANAGTFYIPVDKAGRALARGMYQCRMEAEGFSKTIPVFLK